MKLNKIINFILTTSPLLGLSSEVGDKGSTQISLKIKTNWSQNSPSLELLELLTLDSPSTYYKNLELIFKNIITETNKASTQKTFQNTLNLFKKELGSQKNFDLLNLGLSLKLTSSKLETKLNYFDNYIKGKFDKECGNWLQVNGEQLCNIKEFENWLNSNKLDKIENEAELLPFDIIYPTKNNQNHLTIPYYTNFNEESLDFYTSLVELTNKYNNFNFSLRYQPTYGDNKNEDKVELTGYGVYLDLKSTEYKVQDDRYQNKNSKGTKPTEEDSKINKIPAEYENIWNEELSNFQKNIQPIKKYEDSDLEGFNQKLTQLIKSTKSPLQTWIYLLQNLPHHAPSIINETLSEGHCEGITLGRNFFFQQPIQDQILINGIDIDLGQLDIFNLFKFLNLEFNTIKLFNDLGVSDNGEVRDLLIGKFNENIESGEEELESVKEAKLVWENVYNTRDNEEGENSKVLIWLNNIEKDEIYEDWSSELSSLQNYMYGYLPQTRRNFANSVFPLNLNNLEGLKFFAKNLIKFSSSPVPIRFGLVTLLDSDNNEDSKNIINLVHYIFEHLTKSELKDYLDDVLKSSTETNAKILESFKKHYPTLKKNNSELKLSLEEVLNIEEDKYIVPTVNYSNRLQLNIDEDLLFINGKRVNFDGNFQKPLIQNLFQQIPLIMEMASEGHLDSDINIYDHWLNQPQVLNSFNPLLTEEKFNNLDLISWINSSKEHNPLNQFKFIQSKSSNDDERESDQLTTIWIIGSFDNTTSDLVIDTIKYLKNNMGVRLSFVPTNLKSKTNKLIFNLISNSDQLSELPESYEELKSFKFKNKSKDSESYFQQVQSYFNQITNFNINEDDNGIQLVLDTKLLKVQPKELRFIQLKSIIDYYKIKFQSELAKKLNNSLKKYSTLNEIEKSNQLIQIQSILNYNLEIHQSLVRFGTFNGERGTLPNINRPQCELNIINDKGDDDNKDTWANIEFILDPLGENAAKWSSILSKLSEIEGIKLKGYLSPNSGSGEFKKTHLNRFYRYLLPNKLEFNNNGKLKSPKIEFSNLPQNSLLTLGLDTMTSWVVTAKESPDDLDNLKLSTLPRTGTHPEFELKHLLVEGHCTDFDRRPPRGLEFNLGNNQNPNIVDTIVMANLGYFQFKANPGVWQMRVRPGKSDEVYELVNIGDQGHSKSGKYIDEGRTIILDSLSGITLFPKVKKRKGMENIDLLEVKEEEKPKKSGGMWNSLFGSSKQSAPAINETNPHGDINVFTVASGHLYERFLSVMVASVMKNTDRKVKFWFIENFLSPSFKKFIPKLSEKYNFTYQMVTYQWPHWLNIPSEKQRIIWGYKILFLDVLFPLDLDKVIFVDADQSVRADLGELVDLDLEGKPYGYTPFCTSRESMKGYRFWEQGYWKSHLDGKPYHISALYVVDLKRFRSQAAGDILRQHYQMLSQDPNSLANLDQDLPNHLQHELPIHSLPQEWLWCETWCDDASLKFAKTIDLCNNPETKEPKLDRARRILPEWENFDDEVRSLDTDSSDNDEKVKELKSEKSSSDADAEDEEL